MAATRFGLLPVTVTVLLVLASCGAPVPQHDPGLEGALLQARDNAETVRLADLTPFAWDAVYIFEPYVDGELVNETVGEEVIDADFKHSVESEDLFIFLHDGELAHAATARRVGIGPDSDRRFIKASAEAWLVPIDPADDGGPLSLVEEPPDG